MSNSILIITHVSVCSAWAISFSLKKAFWTFGHTHTYLYNKTRHSYIYMFPLACQTAGPIGLKFFVDTHGWPGGVLG